MVESFARVRDELGRSSRRRQHQNGGNGRCSRRVRLDLRSLRDVAPARECHVVDSRRMRVVQGSTGVLRPQSSVSSRSPRSMLRQHDDNATISNRGSRLASGSGDTAQSRWLPMRPAPARRHARGRRRRVEPRRAFESSSAPAEIDTPEALTEFATGFDDATLVACSAAHATTRHRRRGHGGPSTIVCLGP